MKFFVRMCLALMLVLSLCALAQADFNKTKIAVLDFNLQGSNFETEDMGKIVAEWFITALVKEGRFEVVERGMLQKIIAEQKLALSGLVDESTATQLGKVLGVKVVITGTVMKLQNITEINARIIDVESASIITAENVRSTSTTSLQQLVVQMSEKIIKNFPLEGYIVQRTGQNVTIDLGQRAGVKEGMEFSVYKEGNVIKHPKTGEVLDVQQIETGKIKIASVRGKISEAKIVNETSKGAVGYGHLVKSVRGPLKPQQPVIVQPVVQTVTAPVAKPSAANNAQKYVKQIKSGDARSQRDAAKRIIREQLFDSHVMDVVSSQLKQDFNQNARDRNHIDAMAWMCKALGASGNSKYRDTLTLVSKEAQNRKLRGYAQKSLAQL